MDVCIKYVLLCDDVNEYKDVLNKLRAVNARFDDVTVDNSYVIEVWGREIEGLKDLDVIIKEVR